MPNDKPKTKKQKRKVRLGKSAPSSRQSSNRSNASRRSSGHKVKRAESIKQYLPKLRPIAGSGHATAVARAVALPLNYGARLPDTFAKIVTSTANPFEVWTVDFSQPVNPAAASSTPFSQGGFFAAMSRDPLNALIVSLFNPATDVYIYSTQYYSASGGFDIFGALYPTIAIPPEPTGVNVEVGFTIACANWKTGPKSYGQVQFGKRAVAGHAPDSLRFLWIDASVVNSTYVDFLFSSDPQGAILLPASGGAFQGTLTTYVYDGDSVLVDHVTNVLTTLSGWKTTLTLQSSAYYAFAYNGCPTVSYTIFATLNVIGTMPVTLAHLPIAGFSDRRADIEQVRVIGKSLMLSPNSAELAKGGVIAGLQLPSQELPTSLVPFSSSTNATTAVLARAGCDGNVRSLDFSQGMYAFHSPTALGDFDFRTPFAYGPRISPSDASTRPTPTDFISWVKPAGGWVVMALQTAPPVLGNSGFPGGLVRLTTASALEFQTSSLWYALRSPSLNTLAVDELMSMLANVEQFSENPFHFSDISRWISRNANTLKKVSNIASHALGVLFPEGRGAFKAVDDALQRL